MTPRERAFDGPPIDVVQSFGPLRLGSRDPTARLERDAFAKAMHTADGPATLRIEHREGAYRARAWGPGAARALACAEGVATSGDTGPRHDDATWSRHPLVRRLARHFHGLRLPRAPWVFDVLTQKILEQRVRWVDAAGAYRSVVLRYGREAPGPFALRLPVEPRVLMGVPPEEWLALGVDRRRAGTLREAARAATRLDATTHDEAPAEARSRVRMLLDEIPGVGPWTTACVLGYAMGDADAAIVGDLKLPSLVAWALAGEPRATDARMLELLAPFAGQRFRVQRWLQSAGIVVPRERRARDRSAPSC